MRLRLLSTTLLALILMGCPSDEPTAEDEAGLDIDGSYEVTVGEALEVTMVLDDPEGIGRTAVLGVC